MNKDTGIVEIHGKQYQTVAYRVGKFRESHPMISLTTEILFRDQDEVVMIARISDEQGRVIATGHAEEQRSRSQINRTSALENAETSAIGRALASFGLGGTEFATADEVANAIHQQNQPPQQRATDQQNNPAPSDARQKINNDIVHALDTLFGDSIEEKKATLIDLTTWEKDGKTILGKPDYRGYSDKQAGVVAKELKKMVDKLENEGPSYDSSKDDLPFKDKP